MPLPRAIARRWLALCAALLVAAGVVLWIEIGRDSDTGPGALSPIGLAAGGGLGFGHPAAGHVYYLGLPQFDNTSSEPAHVLGFEVADASANIRVLDYRVYSTDQFDGAMVAGYDPTRPEKGIDFAATRPLHLPYLIRPREQSHRFAMAKVRLMTYPPPGEVTGCTVTYTLGSSDHRYVQPFDCTFWFGEHASDYYDGHTTVQLVNSYRRAVLLLGCPMCKRGGVKLPGDGPHPRRGDGGSIGWDVDGPDYPTLRFVVDGRPVVCRPPATANSASAILTGPDLYYDITPAGRCVVLN